jgi:hypothetical protein
MTIDLAALTHHLSAIGWTTSRLADIIAIEPANKAAIWALIKPGEANVRHWVNSAKIHFPQAQLEGIR